MGDGSPGPTLQVPKEKGKKTDSLSTNQCHWSPLSSLRPLANCSVARYPESLTAGCSQGPDSHKLSSPTKRKALPSPSARLEGGDPGRPRACGMLAPDRRSTLTQPNARNLPSKIITRTNAYVTVLTCQARRDTAHPLLLGHSRLSLMRPGCSRAAPAHPSAGPAFKSWLSHHEHGGKGGS